MKPIFCLLVIFLSAAHCDDLNLRRTAGKGRQASPDVFFDPSTGKFVHRKPTEAEIAKANVVEEDSQSDSTVNPKDIYDRVTNFKNSPGPQYKEEQDSLKYNHFTSPEEVIIGTKSNSYLKEHQAKYPAYHFTIGGKGDPLAPSTPSDQSSSSFDIEAPVKKYPEESDFLKESDVVRDVPKVSKSKIKIVKNFDYDDTLESREIPIKKYDTLREDPWYDETAKKVSKNGIKFNDNYWDKKQEEFTTPMVPKTPKVFQYDYTIGEDVSPFKLNGPTEPMSKSFEATTPWTTTTTTTTSAPITTTEFASVKRIKKLSTRKSVIMTRRPAADLSRSTSTESFIPTISERRTPHKPFTHLSSTRRPPIIATTPYKTTPTTTATTTTTTTTTTYRTTTYRTTTTRPTTTTTTTTTTTSTTASTTEFQYVKYSKPATPYLNKIQPKLSKTNKVTFPDSHTDDSNQFESISDLYPEDETSVMTKSKVTFPKDAFKKSQNRNEIISDIYPEDDEAKFPHFPIKKSTQILSEEDNVFDGESSGGYDDNYYNSPPARQSVGIPTKPKKDSEANEEKVATNWSSKTERVVPKLTPRPSIKSTTITPLKVKLPSRKFHPKVESSPGSNPTPDYEDEYPLDHSMDNFEKEAPAEVVKITTTTLPPHSWNIADEQNYDFTKPQRVLPKPSFDYDEYEPPKVKVSSLEPKLNNNEKELSFMQQGPHSLFPVQPQQQQPIQELSYQNPDPFYQQQESEPVQAHQQPIQELGYPNPDPFNQPQETKPVQPPRQAIQQLGYQNPDPFYQQEKKVFTEKPHFSGNNYMHFNTHKIKDTPYSSQETVPYHRPEPASYQKQEAAPYPVREPAPYPNQGSPGFMDFQSPFQDTTIGQPTTKKPFVVFSNFVSNSNPVNVAGVKKNQDYSLYNDRGYPYNDYKQPAYPENPPKQNYYDTPRRESFEDYEDEPHKQDKRKTTDPASWPEFEAPKPGPTDQTSPWFGSDKSLSKPSYVEPVKKQALTESPYFSHIPQTVKTTTVKPGAFVYFGPNFQNLPEPQQEHYPSYQNQALSETNVQPEIQFTSFSKKPVTQPVRQDQNFQSPELAKEPLRQNFPNQALPQQENEPLRPFQNTQSKPIKPNEPSKQYPPANSYQDSVLFQPSYQKPVPSPAKAEPPLQELPLLKDNPLLPLPMPGYSAPDLYGKDVPRAKRKDNPPPIQTQPNSDEYYDDYEEEKPLEFDTLNTKKQTKEQSGFYPQDNLNFAQNNFQNLEAPVSRPHVAPTRETSYPIPGPPPPPKVMVRPYGEPSLPPVLSKANYRPAEKPRLPPPPPPPRQYPQELMSSPTERPPRFPQQPSEMKKRPLPPQQGIYGGPYLQVAPAFQVGNYPREKSGPPPAKGGYNMNVFNKREGGLSNAPVGRNPSAQPRRGPASRKQGSTSRKLGPRRGQQQKFPLRLRRGRQEELSELEDEESTDDYYSDEEYPSTE